ncbi:MAG: hypothetical protein QOD41_2576, partial [Cryptosporangiaceae bacterium]|nr:hypothetical protein [Cryptosporangiaceae bacterium]
RDETQTERRTDKSAATRIPVGRD